MLKIRPEQIAVFSEAEVRKFEDWTLAHVKRFFPRQYATAGEAEIRRRIRDGIKRAAAYGITSKRDVCKFIDVMIMAGPEFESDSRFPWAKEILERGVDSYSKIAALTDYIEPVLRSA
jgi:hypothetical protein